jgi:D-glycero-D-manno-heptose 1,7-bisphosphate phosphatase
VAILDRDGTMVIDRGYLSDPDGLEFERGAPEGLCWLFDHGYRLIVITNQSGIGRGYFPVERMDAMNERLSQMVHRLGARLAGIYYCPHAPDDGCECRKPKPGLLQRNSRSIMRPLWSSATGIRT